MTDAELPCFLHPCRTMQGLEKGSFRPWIAYACAWRGSHSDSNLTFGVFACQDRPQVLSI